MDITIPVMGAVALILLVAMVSGGKKKPEKSKTAKKVTKKMAKKQREQLIRELGL